jgi:hypothetical protein
MDAAALPDVNTVLYTAAQDAVRALSKRLDMHLSFPEPSPDPKAADAEIPLISGEIVAPIPGMERARARVQVSPTMEVNGSPPGLSRETADVLEAVVDAELPHRVMDLERQVTRTRSDMEAIRTTLAEALEAFMEGQERIQRELEIIVGGYTALTRDLERHQDEQLTDIRSSLDVLTDNQELIAKLLKRMSASLTSINEFLVGSQGATPPGPGDSPEVA